MPNLSLEEQAIRAVLLKHARDSEDLEDALVTYSQLGYELMERGYSWSYPGLIPPFRGLGNALGEVSRYEWALGRPLLSALVVKAETNLPGAGFVDALARSLGLDVGSNPDEWVRNEQRRVTEFWRDADQARITDVAFLRVFDHIERLRREMRRPD